MDREAKEPFGSAWDQLTADLRDLRAQRGHPSFNDLVLGITEVRVARGVPREAARPGRTTVYDAFRPGRRRIDPRLVGDIVRALGEEEDVAEEWERRCAEARSENIREAITSVPQLQPQQVVEVATPAEPDMSIPSEPEVVTPDPVPETELATPPDPGQETEVADSPAPAPSVVSSTSSPDRAGGGAGRVALILLAGLAVNVLGRLLVTALDVALHLDMVGTAVVAFALGPWAAVGLAVVTATAGIAVSGMISLSFLPVSIAGALVLGYGYHRFQMGTTPRRGLALGVITAVVCTAVAVPILLAHGGLLGRTGEQTAEIVRELTDNLPTAVLVSNLLYSLGDKLLTVFGALAILDLARSMAQPAPAQDRAARSGGQAGLLARAPRPPAGGGRVKRS